MKPSACALNLSAALAATLTLLAATAVSAGELVLERAQIGHLGAEPGQAVRTHGGVEVVDTWLPCELILVNRGGGTFAGRVVVRGQPDTWSTTSHRRYERALQLEPGARKRVVIPVRYDAAPGWAWTIGFEDDERGRFELAKSSTHDALQGSVLGGGRLLLPERRTAREPLVLVLRGQGALATQLGALQGPLGVSARSSDLTREWRLVELPGVEALPERGQLLDRVDVVVLDDLDLARLGAEREAAILSWVNEGGRLWVSTLQATPGEGPLGRALPGDAGAIVADTRLSELETILGEAPSLSSANSLRRFRPRAGERGWRPGEQTSGVVHRRCGAGWIVRAGFRLTTAPFPRANLIRELLALQGGERAQRSGAGPRLLKELSTPLRESTLKSVPSRGVVALLILLYLGLGIGLPFVAFRRSGRLELAWACVALSTALASGAVAVLGRESAQTSRIVRVSLSEGGARGATLRTSGLSVFSSAGGPLELEFEHAVESATLLNEPSDSGARAEERAASYPLGERTLRLQTRPQAAVLVALRDQVEQPGEVRLVQTGPASARVERSDEPGWELRGAWAFDSDGAALPDLELPSELATGPRHIDPVLEIALEGAQQLASARAREAGAPLLLYWWAGRPLQTRLPEFGLDLGLVRAAPGWGAWGKPATTLVQFAYSSTEDAEEPLPGAGPPSHEFCGRLPDETRRVELTVGRAPSLRFFLPASVTWSAPTSGRSPWDPEPVREQTIEGALRVTPLGVAWGRVSFVDRDPLDPGEVLGGSLKLRARREAVGE